ncbi:MAG: hypothetical protein M3O34_00235 [Chloroflexota bacterium]|nr:hypothetical protein [Chloroflexota bacterium]
MFGFMRKSAVRPPSAEICRALEAIGLPPGCDDPVAAFQVAELHGRYSGRKVTHIRIFDPSTATARGVAIRAYGDLDAHPDLVLWTGRVEQDGTVNITRQAAPSVTEGTTRQAADRTMHGDVEHLLNQPVDR